MREWIKLIESLVDANRDTEASGVNTAMRPSTPILLSETAVAPLAGGARGSETRPHDTDQQSAFRRLQELAQFKPKMPVKTSKRPKR